MNHLVEALDICTGIGFWMLLYGVARLHMRERTLTAVPGLILVLLSLGGVLYLGMGIVPGSFIALGPQVRTLYFPAVVLTLGIWFQQVLVRPLAKLEGTTQLFSALVAASPLAIVAVDQKRCVTQWNPAAEKLFGWTADEVLGRLVPVVAQGYNGEFVSLFDDIEGQNSFVGCEAQCKCKDGHLIAVCQWMAPVAIQNQSLARAMAIFEDISERRNLSKALEQGKQDAEKANVAKTVFLANVSHELRTPLSAVIGFSDLLLTDDILESDRANFLNTINRNAKLLNRLISDILDVCKIEAGEMQLEKIPTVLRDLLGEVVDTLSFRAREKGLTLKLEMAQQTLPVIKTDPTRLKQILLNLAGNAVKFTGQGNVKLSCSIEPHPGAGDWLTVEVADTGPGMSKGQSENLFRPFAQADSSITRKFGGTGLGLFVSRSLAHALGGDIRLKRTQPGLGSVFEFYMPIEIIDVGPPKPSRMHGAVDLALHKGRYFKNYN